MAQARKKGGLNFLYGVSLNGRKLSGGDAVAVEEQGALELSATKPSQVLLFDLN
jgi:hypothetical protein